MCISPFRWCLWVGLVVPRRKVRHPENVCGGGDAMRCKLWEFPRKLIN